MQDIVTDLNKRSFLCSSIQKLLPAMNYRDLWRMTEDIPLARWKYLVKLSYYEKDKETLEKEVREELEQVSN